MDKINIRQATVTDAELIALLARITFTETFGHLFSDRSDLQVYYKKTFSVAKIRASIEKSNNIFWLALVDELPVGYAKLKMQSNSPFISSDKVAQLQKIYVLKDFLSMKIGFQLQDILLNTARENGQEYIWLSVLDSNERAISFYKRNDFIVSGNHDFQIGKEHFEFLVLSRLL